MPTTERGFSLIELIVVMVVLGVLSGFLAMFITKPVLAYLAAQRRAELVDIADTALLRIARDVRLALPNSVRRTVDGAGRVYLEFLPVAAGGRYRTAQDSTVACADYPDDNATPGCNVLDLTTTDSSFDILGPAMAATAGQFLVVYNTGNSATAFDAWQGGNRREVTSSGSVSTLAMTATTSALPGGSPAHRFFLVDKPVSYVCDPAGHNLRRYWGYDPQSNQPLSVAAAPLSTASSALLAKRVADCDFTYSPGASQRLGQLTLRIRLENADGGDPEQIALYREVAVNNAP